jgi:preprotein translocase subunit YajC
LQQTAIFFGIVFVKFVIIMKMPNSIPNPFIKPTILLLVVISISIYVFAIDGTNGAAKKSTKVFSSIKSDLRLNLHSGFHYNGSKILNIQRSGSSIMTNSVVMYQKRNITWVVPQKTKVSIFNRFKTPSPTSH